MHTFLGLPAALQEFADQRVWTLWKLKKKGNGDYTKPPYQPNNKLASPKDPNTWVTFAEALAAYEKGGFDGIGICLLNLELLAFDLDKVRDPTSGELAPFARQLVERAASYTEITPSKRGIRILARDDGPELYRRQPLGLNGMKLETFRRADAFITVTGDRLPDAPEQVADVGATNLGEEIVAEVPKKGGRRSRNRNLNGASSTSTTSSRTASRASSTMIVRARRGGRLTSSFVATRPMRRSSRSFSTPATRSAITVGIIRRVLR